MQCSRRPGKTPTVVALILAIGLLAAPLAADAQQAGKVPRIGYLSSHSPETFRVEVFRQGLPQLPLGLLEGPEEYTVTQYLCKTLPLSEKKQFCRF